MKKLIYILAITTFSTITLFGQEVKPCDIEVLGHTNSNLDKLTSKEIKSFLLTFDKSCDNNVEYSEFSNELLFKILDKHTVTILTTLEKEGKNLKKEKIIYEFSDPINDSFDIKELIIKVDKIKIDDKLKGQIIEKLKEALAKQ